MRVRVIMAAWPMVMMRVPIHFRDLRRRAATIHRRALRHLDLYRRMLNPKIPA
jgi:hypothetical protein